LYGYGLRLSEGMNLRVTCFNFDTLILTVDNGKGKKVRTVPIRTIQELPGHSDVRTTMIYIHTIKSQTIKDAKSPLDFYISNIIKSYQLSFF
jgi:site-specific recombinase XerD